MSSLSGTRKKGMEVSDPKHTKITEFEEQEDGTLLITTSSYFEELSSIKQKVAKNVKTSKATFLSDIISCLDPVNKQQTKELTLTIVLDEWNQPAHIVKEYTIKKENYKRR